MRKRVDIACGISARCILIERRSADGDRTRYHEKLNKKKIVKLYGSVTEQINTHLLLYMNQLICMCIVCMNIVYRHTAYNTVRRSFDFFFSFCLSLWLKYRHNIYVNISSEIIWNGWWYFFFLVELRGFSNWTVTQNAYVYLVSQS